MSKMHFSKSQKFDQNEFQYLMESNKTSKYIAQGTQSQESRLKSSIAGQEAKEKSWRYFCILIYYLFPITNAEILTIKVETIEILGANQTLMNKNALSRDNCLSIIFNAGKLLTILIIIIIDKHIMMQIDLAILNKIFTLRRIEHIKNLMDIKIKQYSLDENQLANALKKDIMALAKKLNKRLLKTQISSVSEKWMWKEHKLFLWVIIYYAQALQIETNSITKPQFQIIGDLFPQKEMSFLHYEYTLAFLNDTSSRSLWHSEEIEILENILNHKSGENQWKVISYELYKHSEGRLFKTAENCRNRWENHSNPIIKRAQWAQEESIIMLNFIIENGTKWAYIAKYICKGRTEHMVKNNYRRLLRIYKINQKQQSIEEICHRLIGILYQKIAQRMAHCDIEQFLNLDNKKDQFSQKESIQKTDDSEPSSGKGNENFEEMSKNQSNVQALDVIPRLSIDQIINVLDEMEFGENHKYIKSIKNDWLDNLMEVDQIESQQSIDIDCF